MLDNIINRLNAWGKKTKREIYDNVIEFKDRPKNLYHWDYDDDLYGLLEQTKPHETDTIPAEFTGVKFDADEVEVTATDQEVENDNIMVTRCSYNAIIVHGTFHNDGIEGTASPQLAAAADNDDIKEVDMPENEPAEIINVDTDDATYGDQEYPTDNNTDENPSQNQDGVSNTEYFIAVTADKDINKDRADRDNSEGSIKIEYVDDEYDGNVSDDDVGNVMGVDGR